MLSSQNYDPLWPADPRAEAERRSLHLRAVGLLSGHGGGPRQPELDPCGPPQTIESAAPVFSHVELRPAGCRVSSRSGPLMVGPRSQKMSLIFISPFPFSLTFFLFSFLRSFR